MLSLREASEQCGISTSRLRRLAASGVLQATKAGAYWIVSERAVAEFQALERPRGVRTSARAEAPHDKKR
jgi:hypothetical protein